MTLPPPPKPAGSEVEWIETLPDELDKADRVARELQTRPNHWAKIATQQPAIRFSRPWWSKFTDHPDYEIHTISAGQGIKDVYARYVGKLPPKAGM